MQWADIRVSDPDQWQIIVELEAYKSPDNIRQHDTIAVVERPPSVVGAQS